MSGTVDPSSRDRRPPTRWLITGAGGQLGRSLLGVAPQLGLEALGRSRAQLDVLDAGAIAHALAEFGPDVVLNCAALTNVDECEQRTDEAMRVNGEAPGVLARACAGRAVLIHISTEYVFPGDTNQPLDEEAKPAPRSAYGRSKLAGEEGVRAAGGEHLIVRTQWVFGPGPNFVRTVLAAADRGEALNVVEDQLGRPTWSGALARALVEAAAAGARGTLHLACEGVASWYDLALAAVSEGTQRGLNPWVKVRPVATSEVPRPAKRPTYAVLGLGRARQLGIELVHWRDALSAYLAAEAEGRDA